MRIRKFAKIALVVFLCLSCISLTALADGEAYAEETIEIDIPDGLREYLPENIEGFRASDVMERFDFGFFTKTFIRILTEAAPDAAKSFALLLGVMILCAVLGVLKRTVASGGLQLSLDLVGMVCVASAVFAVTESAFGLAEEFVGTLAAFMKRITPVMSGFMIAGGEITSAAVTSGVIFTAVSVLEQTVASVLFPLIRLSLCMSVVSTVFGIPGISGLAPTIRKLTSYVFGFVTASLSAVLMFQRIIAKSTDSLAMRGIRFAVGQFVPFVGGAVNEALATVMGGIGTIKAATGVVSAVTVCLIAAVPVIRVLLHKMFLELISVFAGILGLSGEGRLMGEVGSYLGYTAAVMAISAVFFILSLSMMAAV
jgi:stage III sporulation protein AE